MNDVSTSDSARSEFVYTRVINAPRNLVFEAYTQPEHLQHWWGPKGMGINVHRFELRPGGTFLYGMVLPDGHESFGKLVYREVEPTTKLVFVVSFTDADGNPVRHPMAATWPLEVLSTVEFSEENGKTTLTMTSRPINAADEDHAIYASSFAGMTGGTDGMMENFEAYLDSVIKSA